VRRAQELAAASETRQVSGTRILVVVGPHGEDGAAFVESPLWLGEIRRRLTPSLPLGQRLDVIAPRYLNLHITARVVAAPQLDPDEVKKRIEETLREKLSLVGKPDQPAWPFGRDVTLLAIKGWVRNVKGVAKVADVQLRGGDAQDPSDRVALGAIGLPLLTLDADDITVERFPLGGRP
jgi:hypothetical protein